MLLTILAVSIFLGLFFRSFNAFMAGFFGLLFFIYPIQFIGTLLTCVGIAFLTKLIRSDNNEQSKLNNRSDRNDN